MATGGDREVKVTSKEFLSEIDQPQYCQPCGTDNQKVRAVGFCSNCKEFLCDDCFSCHTRPSLMRHHVLQRTVKEAIVKSVKDKCSEKCTKHDKQVKYYCPSHDYIGCSVCITLQHRRCEDVTYISEVSKNLPDSVIYQDFIVKLNSLQKQLEELVPKAEQSNEYAEQNHQVIVATIQAFRKKINNAFDILETTASAQAQEAKEKETRKFESITSACNEMLAKIEDIASRLERLVACGKMCDAYMAMKKADREFNTLEQSFATMKGTCNLIQYRFYPNKSLLPKQRGSSGLGTLSSIGNTSRLGNPTGMRQIRPRTR